MNSPILGGIDIRHRNRYPRSHEALNIILREVGYALEVLRSFGSGKMRKNERRVLADLHYRRAGTRFEEFKNLLNGGDLRIALNQIGQLAPLASPNPGRSRNILSGSYGG